MILWYDKMQLRKNFMEKLYGGSIFVALPKKLEIPEIDDKRLKKLYQLYLIYQKKEIRGGKQ